MPCHCGLDVFLLVAGDGGCDEVCWVLLFLWLRFELGDVATELSVGVGIVEFG